MMEVNISKSLVFEVVAHDLKVARRQNVKVFRTFIRSGIPVDVDIITTSKDVHLRLGQLSTDGQMELASGILKVAAEVGSNGTVLLFENEVREDALLATVTRVREGWAIINMNPAH